MALFGVSRVLCKRPIHSSELTRTVGTLPSLGSDRYSENFANWCLVVYILQPICRGDASASVQSALKRLSHTCRGTCQLPHSSGSPGMLLYSGLLYMLFTLCTQLSARPVSIDLTLPSLFLRTPCRRTSNTLGNSPFASTTLPTAHAHALRARTAILSSIPLD